jgi:UPF0755 protein
METPKKKPAFSIITSCFLPLIAGSVLVCVVTGALMLSLPGRAAEKFGPPASDVSGFQRYLLSFLLILNSTDLTLPLNPAGSPVHFEVSLGEPTTSIIGRLSQEGLIANPSVMRIYLQYSGLDTSLQAGEYELSPAMTSIEIAQAMQDATPNHVTFTVLPGWRLEEIAQTLPTSGLEISPEAFLSAAKVQSNNFAFLQEIAFGTSLEGFMAPGTYEIPRDISAPALVRTLLAHFGEQLSPDLQSGFSTQRLTIQQAVTLASIIQREAVLDEEMPLIASVFLNRLSVGMNLAADPTVQYAMGYNQSQQSWWTNPLSASDLQIDSPYNSYLYPGLPPTPISNPSLSALQSVAFPDQTTYFYFRAACDGSGRHLFSETYEEHIQNQCQP